MQPMELHIFIQIFLGFCGVVGIIIGLVRWADGKLEKRIVAEIRESTYQIQPNSNGGASLRDLHKKVDRMMGDMSLLKTAVLRLEGEVRELEEDVEDLR